MKQTQLDSHNTLQADPGAVCQPAGFWDHDNNNNHNNLQADSGAVCQPARVWDHDVVRDLGVLGIDPVQLDLLACQKGEDDVLHPDEDDKFFLKNFATTLTISNIFAVFSADFVKVPPLIFTVEPCTVQ